VTPVGNVPVSLNVGLGVPVAVTVNDPEVPTVNVVLLALVITGAVSTVSVKLCVAAVPTPLLAVNVMGYVPAVPAPGVPLRTAVPALNVTPVGNVPVSLRLGAGKPVAVTVNVPAAPTENVVLLALVMAGAWSTVSVKFCVALLPTPLLAVKVIEYVLPVPAAGVPLSFPVPLPLSVKVTPLGSAPDSLRLGAGKPVVVTVNVPAVPTVNVTLLPLVMAGGWPMVMLKAFVAVIAVGVLESVAVTVKLEVPAVVGMPEITPFAAKTNPVGRDPGGTVQVMGVAPPADSKVAL
jgi:hypothetical protein